MNTIEAYQCENCTKTYTNAGRASDCCICIECNKPKGHTLLNTECGDCRSIVWARADMKRLSRMETVNYTTDMVLNNDSDKYLFDDDGVYCFLDDMDRDEWPEYLLVCDPTRMTLDVDDILESAASDHYEDSTEFIPRRRKDELQKHLDKFCDDVDIVTWYENGNQRVSVDQVASLLGVTKEAGGT